MDMDEEGYIEVTLVEEGSEARERDREVAHLDGSNGGHGV